MSNEAIRFSGMISKELFLNANRLHMRRRLILSVVAVMVLWLGTATLLGAEMKRAFGAIAIGCAVLFLLVAILRRFAWRRVYEKSPYIREMRTGVVSQQGLHVETSMGNSDVPWPKFIRARSSDGILLIYLGPNAFQILSKEFFASPADWEAARGIVLEQVRH
jgi:hypothetical protein